MLLCLFEDRDVSCLEPLTLTRPAFDLWCGGRPLWVHQSHYFACSELGALVRPFIAEISRLDHPHLSINDPFWLQRGVTVLVNARWLPPPGQLTDLATPRVGMVNDTVAFVVLPPGAVPPCSLRHLPGWISSWEEKLPTAPAGGVLMTYPWDLVEANASVLKERETLLPFTPTVPAGVSIVGPREGLLLDPTASVEPCVVIDTRPGPVIIDRGAIVQAFSRLEGPCYIGQESHILGARVRASTIGPVCRVGGEVEASIIQGYSNKAHDGFLGHSYVGAWVNLGAGTQTSDLRNDYGRVSVPLGGQATDSGLRKVGAFIGDHTKTGLNCLLNTGSVVGAFCNILPTGSLLPKFIPSFCTIWHGQLREREDLPAALATAATMMRRRGCRLSPAHADFVRALAAATADDRFQAIRSRDLGWLRRALRA